MGESSIVEAWHTCPDGKKLYTKTWKPAGQSKARVVLVHGFSDHCNNYEDLILDLNAQSIEVFGFDQRGWGRSVQSPKDKGLTGPTSQVLADIDSILKRFTSTESSSESRNTDRLPLFLFGHSMGGQETLHYAALPPSKSANANIRGYILDAPFLGLSPETKPSPIVVFFGRLASKFLPHRQMVNKIDLKLVSRDVEVQKKYEKDELCHNTGTLEGLGGMLDRMAAFDAGDVVLKDDDDLKKSIWIGHGTADGVCDFEATKHWYDNYCLVEDRTFRTYEGWYHQLQSEPGNDKHMFAAEVAKWILDRTEK